MPVKRINIWSGPRNVSTALMYSFAQRSDTKVVDEPFYAHYLSHVQTDHPGKEEVLQSQPQNAQTVINGLLSKREKEVLFIKNMAHHMVAMDKELEAIFEKFISVFLIRDPREVLLSLSKNIPNPAMRDTAFQWQLDLFKKIKALGKPLLVIDSKELLKDPRAVLSALCKKIGIIFENAMLSWKPGALDEDGIWAKYWYKSVHNSTGFKPYQPKKELLPGHLMPLYEECKPIYDRLNQFSIKA